MDLTAQQHEQVSLISITGSVDALTAGEVTQFISQQINAGQNQVVLDLTRVDFMSSAGLRAILATLKESRQNGGDLRLGGAQPGVEKILKMSGFTNILKAYPTVDEAVASFSDEQARRPE